MKDRRKQCACRVYSGHIAIYHQGRRVADHVRLEGKGAGCMQLEHYLGTFLRKPGGSGQL